MGLERDLRAIAGDDAVRPGDTRRFTTDATESAGVRGEATLVVLPADAAAVAAVVAHCYEHDVAIVARGGGTGFSGGAVPIGIDGPAIVLGTERLTRVRAFEPLQWRCHVEAGVTTGTVQRLARESGTFFAPDPGAPEQSTIGGNVATNAGGPHCFKYGVTRAWLTGVEAVLAPGELISVGGATRKDVAGYDLVGLLCGSEGTLGIVTAAWLKLLPRPAIQVPIYSFCADTAAGAEAIAAVMASGAVPATIEFLDGEAIGYAGAAFPFPVPSDAGFLLICEADAQADVDPIASSLPGAQRLTERAAVEALWRWREGVSYAVTAQRGGKLSEDIAVPVDRLADAVDAVRAIGARHGLETCSWGHAGDGNIHASFLFAPEDTAARERVEHAVGDVFAMALELGGTVSGEHGLGWLKRGRLRDQWAPAAVAAHQAVKRALDPKGLLNPHKKTA